MPLPRTPPRSSFPSFFLLFQVASSAPALLRCPSSPVPGRAKSPCSVLRLLLRGEFHAAGAPSAQSRGPAVGLRAGGSQAPGSANQTSEGMSAPLLYTPPFSTLLCRDLSVSGLPLARELPRPRGARRVAAAGLVCNKAAQLA